MPNSTSPDSWEVFGTSLSPSFEYVQALCAWTSNLREADHPIVFRFAEVHGAQDEVVHHSRLTFAGGPLAALATRDFRERTSRLVTLCPADDPRTFAILRDFLYAKEVNLAHADLPTLLATVRSAHRWQLLPLFQVLCRFLFKCDKFPDADALLTAVDVVSLPGFPSRFRLYFWDRIVRFFPQLSVYPTVALNEDENDGEGELSHSEGEARDVGEGDKESEPVDEALPRHLKRCPRFPGMWDLALAHNVVAKLIEALGRVASRQLKLDLLDVVVRYLEPRVTEDRDVLEMLEFLQPESLREEYLVNGAEEAGQPCTVRAMRLLAQSLIAPSQPRHEMSFSWDVSPWTITPSRMQFLYGPCVADCVQRNNWEPFPVDASMAVNLQVETVSHPLKKVSVIVKWTVGALFPFKHKAAEIVLCLRQPDDCGCCAAVDTKGDDLENCSFRIARMEDRCLFRVVETVRLDRKGEFVEKVGEELFEMLRKHHHRKGKCMLTESLRVRLVGV